MGFSMTSLGFPSSTTRPPSIKITLSLVSLALGRPPALESLENAIPAGSLASDAESALVVSKAKLGFWPVLAVFFPAVTGILSGLGMSGDLEKPGRSIPLGTIAAVVTGYLVDKFCPMSNNEYFYRFSS